MSHLPLAITTRRLELRSPRDGDIPALVRGLGNWNVARWLGRVPHPYHPIHARGWVQRSAAAARAGSGMALVIVRRGGPGHVIGAIGAHGLDRPRPVVGYWFAVAHWGKGYAGEALRAVLAAVIEARPTAIPVATCLPANRRSITVLARTGFKREPRCSMAPNAALRRKMRVLHFTYAGAPQQARRPDRTNST